MSRWVHTKTCRFRDVSIFVRSFGIPQVCLFIGACIVRWTIVSLSMGVYWKCCRYEEDVENGVVECETLFRRKNMGKCAMFIFEQMVLSMKLYGLNWWCLFWKTCRSMLFLFYLNILIWFQWFFKRKYFIEI